ncbi:MAG: DUF934 domain-containing protein [Novosphingobium sp.]
MDETLLRLRVDAASGAPVLPLADFLASDNAAAVRIEPGEDARKLLPHLGRIALIEVAFPAYGDGRGYSSARILREAGYQGELRATDDVLLDQLSHMKRCGFDAFAPAKPIAAEAAQKAFATWPEVYQKTIDGRNPIWAKRHGD